MHPSTSMMSGGYGQHGIGANSQIYPQQQPQQSYPQSLHQQPISHGQQQAQQSSPQAQLAGQSTSNQPHPSHPPPLVDDPTSHAGERLDH